MSFAEKRQTQSMTILCMFDCKHAVQKGSLAWKIVTEWHTHFWGHILHFHVIQVLWLLSGGCEKRFRSVMWFLHNECKGCPEYKVELCEFKIHTRCVGMTVRNLEVSRGECMRLNGDGPVIPHLIMEDFSQGNENVTTIWWWGLERETESVVWAPWDIPLISEPPLQGN